MTQEEIDVHFMKQALKEAEYAMEADEVPVGCVIVADGKIVARGHNLVERLHDFTAHAEMQAFTAASEYLNGKSLIPCTLYVTLEPCVMCAGALMNARIGTLVYATADLKGGATASLYNVCTDPRLNHQPKVMHGVYEEDAIQLMKLFFRNKRSEDDGKTQP